MSVYDVSPNELIEKAVEELKKMPTIKAPEWASFAKTGAHKERPPIMPDWWYFRVASILRTIYIMGPIGVAKLRTKYGGKKRRGHKPPQFRKGSGSIIRKALQQLDKAGLTKMVEKNEHKGRVITPRGKSLLDKIAVQILKSTPRVERKVEIIIEAPKPKVEKKAEAVVEAPKPKIEKAPAPKPEAKKKAEIAVEAPKPKVEKAEEAVKE